MSYCDVVGGVDAVTDAAVGAAADESRVSLDLHPRLNSHKIVLRKIRLLNAQTVEEKEKIRIRIFLAMFRTDKL